MLTAGQLVEALRALPPDTEVLVAIDLKRTSMAGIPLTARLVTCDHQVDTSVAALTRLVAASPTVLVGEYR